MNFPNFQLTNAGIEAVLQAAYSGSTITFTGVKLGNGTAPANIGAMTDIVSPVATAGITSITVEDGFAELEYSFNNNTLDYGFYLKEMGVMATLTAAAEEGEESEESEEESEEEAEEPTPFLFAYTNAGANAGYIKPYDSDSYVNMVFDVYVAIGNAEHVTAVISSAIGYTSTEDFEAHTHDYNNPHMVTKEQVGLENVPNATPSNMQITFTKAATLTVPTSGSKLSALFGIVAKAVESLRSHLLDNQNPHSTTYGQVGAAPANHTHNAATEVTGVLPVSKGGTGVTSSSELRSTLALNVTYISTQLESSEWSGQTYSFAGIYAANRYNLEASLSPAATKDQQRAFSRAMLAGSHNTNVLTALGKVPQIDIPIILAVAEV